MVPLSSENRMIFWNTPTAAALRARNACAMNKCRLRAARGIVTDGRTPCPLCVLNSRLIAHLYGPKNTQPKKQSSRGKSRGSTKRQQKQGKEPVARGERLRGFHPGARRGRQALCPAFAAAQSGSKSRAKSPSPAASSSRESTLGKMTVDEKIGQLLFTTYHGGFTATDSPAYQQLLHDVQDLHVGGFIVITHGSPLGIVKSQAYPTAVLANQLQTKSKLPLLIGADFERGTAMRYDEGTSFPTAMAVAAGGNPKDAYTMGKITASEARATGVHWVYAPDSDVNNNPANPIINTRSFGENPQRVGEFVSAFVKGVADGSALATAKHFPGHGDTAADSHIDLAVISASRERLEHLELVPFRAAIAAGADTVMTGHLSVPALEPDPNTPATLSPKILEGLLRKELRFQGLIVTDAMDMGGITVRYAPGEAAVRAVVAGVDW